MCWRLDWRRIEYGNNLGTLPSICYARGYPAHLGAVVFLGSRCLWTHMAAPQHILERFVNRKDQQIMGLELFSISLGMCTFESVHWGRPVVIHSDNSGSEVHHCNVSSMWLSGVLPDVFAQRLCKVVGSRTICARTMVPCGTYANANVHRPRIRSR